MFVAEGEFDDHTMICLYLDPAVVDALAVDGGVEAGDLHCTVVYTGRTSGVEATVLRAAVEQVLDRAPVDARIGGLARFSGATADDPDAIVALVDSPGLDDLHADVRAALADLGVDPPRDHGFTPHVTLMYLPADDPGPWDGQVFRQPPISTRLTTVAVKYGTERTEYAFQRPGTSTAELAFQAFASGWAASGGPVVADRLIAGARAAVALAEEDPDRPGLWEATLQLGHLDGTWALIFGRRDDLHELTTAAAVKLWADLVAAVVDVDGFVGDVEDAGMGVAADDEVARTALITTATGYLLGELRRLVDAPGWVDLRTLLVDALVAAHAEGQADAAALAADKAGNVGGFDFDAAHRDASGALAGRDDIAGEADTALHAAIGGTAAVVARSLVSRLVAGAATADLVDHVRGTLATGRTLAVEVRHALDGAFARAMWSLYQAGGLDLVELVTAADGRVCQPCMDAEDAGPYGLFDAPVLPLHHGCRCVLDAVGILPVAVFATYLLGGV